MSTRATVIVMNQKGTKTQYYRHNDGSPFYLGKLLQSFATTAGFLGNIATDDEFYFIMGMDKGFEIEKTGTVHTDIDYCWYVELKENGFVISYAEIKKKFDFDYIENLLRCDEGSTIYFK